jgi:hypothetical protein
MLAVVFELLTVVLRYGFDLDMTRDSAWLLSGVTCGLRLHHGYVGVVLLFLASSLCHRGSQWFQVLLALGLALVISDLVHHFAVMWPLEGDPHFDLVYPDR